MCWACHQKNAGLLADFPLLCYGLLAALFVLQLLGESNMSTASDVYSFGIIMYEMLTFKIPFEECAKAMVRVHFSCSTTVCLVTMYSTARHGTFAARPWYEIVMFGFVLVCRSWALSAGCVVCRTALISGALSRHCEQRKKNPVAARYAAPLPVSSRRSCANTVCAVCVCCLCAPAGCYQGAGPCHAAADSHL